MANYKLILDESVLGDFVEWLPVLREGECYYIALLARNKYIRDLPNAIHMPHIRSDKQQLGRIVCGKEGIHNRIKQLECEIGSYRTRDGDPIPPEALALYITMNPRSHIVATTEALKMMVEYVTAKDKKGYRLDQDVISCIQRACGNRIFMDLDFDGVDLPSTLEGVKKHINASCVTTLKTRGGFHLLIKLDEIADEVKRSWYNGITTLPGVDVRGDNMIPIPGTSQGMFMPHFV